MAGGFRFKVPRLRPYLREMSGSMLRTVDARLFPRHNLRKRVNGRVILVTGASTGIGEVLAYRLAEAGAQLVLVARSRERLDAVIGRIRDGGGRARGIAADLSRMEDCDRVAADVLDHEGAVDILINNAGRSIRRPVFHSLERFHDFQRTMQLNYFGAIRLTMNLLPSMKENGGGHVLNISTVGVQMAPARFSAYLASKGALEGWTMAAANEMGHHNIWYTLVNLPLVRTPMIAPTEVYRYTPAISPDEAAARICRAIITRQKRVINAAALGTMVAYLTLPRLSEAIVNIGYQLTPESDAARGSRTRQPAAQQGGDACNGHPMRRDRRRRRR